MNILIVDDEIQQLDGMRVALRKMGHSALTALNAEEALRYLENADHKIELVITDYAMPGMTGMDLLKRIREKHSSLPVILMTGYSEKDLVIEALRNRCNSFIEKPFTIDELRYEIGKMGNG